MLESQFLHSFTCGAKGKSVSLFSHATLFHHPAAPNWPSDEEVVAFACKWVCRRYFFCYIIAVQPSHLIARPFYRFMILRLKFNSLQCVMWCQPWAKEGFREMMLTCHFAPLNCTFHFLKGLIIFPCYHILNLRSPVLIKWPRDGDADVHPVSLSACWIPLKCKRILMAPAINLDVLFTVRDTHLHSDQLDLRWCEITAHFTLGRNTGLVNAVANWLLSSFALCLCDTVQK